MIQKFDTWRCRWREPSTASGADIQKFRDGPHQFVGIADGTPEALESAVPLYDGDILDGINLREEGFEAWLTGEHARRREQPLDLLVKLFRLCAKNGQCDDTPISGGLANRRFKPTDRVNRPDPNNSFRGS